MSSNYTSMHEVSWGKIYWINSHASTKGYGDTYFVDLLIFLLKLY